MTRLAPALVVFVSLVVGFGIAQSTGVRWLGGVVLVAGGVWAAWLLLPGVGVIRTVVAAVAYVAAFVVSHPLGHVIGSWPSVLLVAALAALVAWAVAAPLAA